MIPSEFDFQMKRLQSHFGKAALGDEKIKLIAPVVARVEADTFLDWVNNLIKFQDKAPKFMDFVNFTKGLEDPDAPIEKCDCAHCDGMGNFIAVDTRDAVFYGYEAQTLFACIYCVAGEKQPKKISRWDKRWLDQGYKLYDRSKGCAI